MPTTSTHEAWTVSYTHLDVYKRQNPKRALQSLLVFIVLIVILGITYAIGDGTPMSVNEDSAQYNTPGSVSYTHLHKVMTETMQLKTLRDSAGMRWLALALVALTMFFAYMFVDILSDVYKRQVRGYR